MIKISIIISLQDYNVSQDNLQACLNSILQQTYKALEIIVIKNTKFPNLENLCSNDILQDTRLKIIEQNYETINEARNIGLQHATGAYVMFVNANDLLLPKAVEDSINIAQRTNSDIVIFEWFNKTSKGIQEAPLPCKIRNFHFALMTDILNNRQPAYTWNKLFSIKFWETTKFNSLVKTEDIDTIKAVCKKASNIFYLPEALYINSQIAN